MTTIGERVRTIRKENKLTQVELGKVIGISGSGVSQIETDMSQPTEAAIRLICSTYNINYIWLTEGRGDMLMPMGTDELVEKYMQKESEFAKSIMKAFAKLPDEEWERLRDLIERIKKEATI